MYCASIMEELVNLELCDQHYSLVMLKKLIYNLELN